MTSTAIPYLSGVVPTLMVKSSLSVRPFPIFFLCTSPIPFLIGIIGAWLSFALKRYRLALMLIGLPLLGVCVILLCVRYGEGF